MFDVSEKKNDNIPFQCYESIIPRIDPDEKKLWTDALISEEYRDKQGQNMLKTPDGNFCCLGVYCEAKGVPNHQVLGKHRNAFGVYLTEDIATYGSDPNDTSNVTIPEPDGIPFVIDEEPSCIVWNRFTGDETIFSCYSPDDGKKYTWTLPGLNDSAAGFTFVHIRDIINYFL